MEKGNVIFEILYFLVGLFLFFVISFSIGADYGRTQALNAVKPCTKESPLVKQPIGQDTWICVDGEWKNP